MARAACLACFISTVNGCSKKQENALEDVALVAGTQQNLNNLYSLDIYGYNARFHLSVSYKSEHVSQNKQLIFCNNFYW
jgi:hypothetical protein